MRAQIETLPTKAQRALALDLALQTGRYALSFVDETSYLRLPLTKAVKRLWKEMPQPVDNKQANTCHRQPAGEFLAEQHVDLALIRLPRIATGAHAHLSEEWYDGWLEGERESPPPHDMETTPSEKFSASSNRFMARAQSRTQYLRFVEELLERAAHLPQWAIIHAADGFLTTDELIETIRHVRNVKTIYTKDFTEWIGVRTSIIIA